MMWLPISLVLGLFTGSARAESPPPLDQIPVERAIASLEKRLGEGTGPESAERLLPLARLHVLAFTHPEQVIGVSKGTEDEYAWPYSTRVEHLHPIDRPSGKREHLARAFALYSRARKIEPKNWIARIGYAWTSDQSGKHAEARRAYRALFKESMATLAHPEPKNLTAYDVGAEAATYLVTMLDPKKDAAEIKRVQEGQNLLYTAQSHFRFAPVSSSKSGI